MVDKDSTVELQDVEHLQHVVLLDDLLRLRDSTTTSRVTTNTPQTRSGETGIKGEEHGHAYPDESAVEVANGEELRDVAAGNGAAAEAGPADDGEAREGDLDEGLELGGLLGGALGEEPHGWLAGS